MENEQYKNTPLKKRPLKPSDKSSEAMAVATNPVVVAQAPIPEVRVSKRKMSKPLKKLVDNGPKKGENLRNDIITEVRSVWVLRANQETLPVQEGADPKPIQEGADPKLIQEGADPKLIQEKTDPKPMQEKADPKPIHDKADPKPIQEKTDPKPIQKKADPKPIQERDDQKAIQERNDPKPIPMPGNVPELKVPNHERHTSSPTPVKPTNKRKSRASAPIISSHPTLQEKEDFNFAKKCQQEEFNLRDRGPKGLKCH